MTNRAEPMAYGQIVKVSVALNGLKHAKSESTRAYWRNTLAKWEEHAKAAGFASLDAWLAVSK